MNDLSDEKVRKILQVQAAQAQMNQELEKQIIGALQQVTGSGLSLSMRTAHARAINDLPEAITISKFSQTADKAFYHLHFTHRGGGIGGLLALLHETTEAVERHIGALSEQGKLEPGRETGPTSPPPSETGNE